MLDALKASINESDQLCETVNSLSHRLGLGRKAHQEDWSEKARTLITEIESPSPVEAPPPT